VEILQLLNQLARPAHRSGPNKWAEWKRKKSTRNCLLNFNKNTAVTGTGVACTARDSNQEILIQFDGSTTQPNLLAVQSCYQASKPACCSVLLPGQ
jgi:hypothetical protein